MGYVKIHQYQDYRPLPYPLTYYRPANSEDESGYSTSDSETEPTQPKFVPAVWPDLTNNRISQQKILTSKNVPNKNMATPKMPSRNNSSAPKFDGKPETLASFIDDVEQLAEECQLADKQKIEWLIHYGPVEERDLWELQPAVKTGDWKQFKDQLYLLYPGSTGDRKFSIGDLEMLKSKQWFQLRTRLSLENTIEPSRKYRNFCLQNKGYPKGKPAICS
jgi:hypothetical protein